MDRRDWRYRSQIERRFSNALSQITRQVRFIVKRYHTLQDITAAIASLTNSPQWQTLALSEALKMTRSLAAENAKTWREAAVKSQNGTVIYKQLRQELTNNGKFIALVQRNANIIRSLPNDIAKHVTEHAASQAIAGLRPEAMIEHIRAAAPGISETRARLIARTETAKTQAAITQVRSEQLGLNWYIWRTSEDQRVRSSHKHMDGVICNFQSPPSPEELIGEQPQGYYGPSETFNCRCYAEPIVDPDFLPASVKVYQNGQIRKLTKREFSELR